MQNGTSEVLFEKWNCKFVPPLPESAEYLAELSGVVGLTRRVPEKRAADEKG
jgi:hypothetical protein